MGRKLEAGDIDWPSSKLLPHTDVELPFYLLGDGGFGLKSYLMTPFCKGKNYGDREKVFNYRLSHARRIIECAFGTMETMENY